MEDGLGSTIVWAVHRNQNTRRRKPSGKNIRKFLIKISPIFFSLNIFLIRSTMRTMRPARIKCKNILSWISAQHSRVQTMSMSMTTTKTGLQTTTANFRREIMSWNFWTKRNLWQFSINNSMSVRVLTTQGNLLLLSVFPILT